MAFLF